MTRWRLSEFQRSKSLPLSLGQREGLRRIYPSMRLDPSSSAEGEYTLTPDQRVGLVCLPGLTIEIRPKVPMASVLFLISYACEAVGWSDQLADFGPDPDLTDLVAIVFARLVERTTRRGLLAGYRTVEEALPAPRGRLLFDEQIRRRMGFALPVEVRHDEFTTDILENRLLLAALSSLGRLPLNSLSARREIARADRLFGDVTPTRYPPGKVPSVAFTRLNQHYGAAISLARLIIESASLNLGAGASSGSAFLVDMNLVFERFLRRALRVALELDEATFPDRAPSAYLDLGDRVRLQPDLCIARGEEWLWIGDAKYKRLPSGAYQNADLYQLLAYAVASDLDDGMLIYAADEASRAGTYIARGVGKQLRVVSIDLSVPPSALRHQIDDVADRVRRAVPAFFSQRARSRKGYVRFA